MCVETVWRDPNLWSTSFSIPLRNSNKIPVTPNLLLPAKIPQPKGAFDQLFSDRAGMPVGLVSP